MKKVLLIMAAAVSLLTGCGQKGYVQLTGYAQGGTWSVKYNTEGLKARPAEVLKGIEAILSDIDTSLSGYNKASLLSRLNTGDTIRPNGMLAGMYRRCRKYWQETEGALDVAAGPVFDIWGFGFKNDSLPSHTLVLEALASSGMDRLLPRLEDALLPDGRLYAGDLVERAVACTADFSGNPVDGLPQLNFNAVAQGFSADTVAGYLRALGAKDMLVDIGEIFCSGVNQYGKPWKIGVDRPTDGNNTPGADLDGIWESSGLPEGQGIVTSGNYRKFYIKDGRKYSHTIDPRTGYPVASEPSDTTLLSATIAAPCSEEADAYATACMVIGLAKARDFIGARSGLEGYLIYSLPDGSMEEWASGGFNLIEKSKD